MVKKENAYKGYDITTQAVHTGTGYDQETGAVRRPLHMANSTSFRMICHRSIIHPQIF